MTYAIRAQNLGKHYRLGMTHSGSIRELSNRMMRRLLGRKEPEPLNGQALQPGVPESLDDDGRFWALRDVSFDVEPGEVVGIIGRNGAGKSTLLKILSRITVPTLGRAELNGRTATMLEVGTGFHPELSGRENVFLNGAILGMQKSEIRKKFDEIVAFAEIERFIDTPVKRYSSGMYIRLAFAVAVHLDPAILIIDEVLAVGDAGFQRKCEGKLNSAAWSGRAVLLVSHNLPVIDKLCKRAFLLSNGKLEAQGPASEIVRRYLQHGLQERSSWTRRDHTLNASGFSFLSAILRDQAGRPCSFFRGDQPIDLEFTYAVHCATPALQVSVSIYNSDDHEILYTGDTDLTHAAPTSRSPGTYKAMLTIPAPLLTKGQYRISLRAHRPGIETYDLETTALGFEVAKVGALGEYDSRTALVSPPIGWQIMPWSGSLEDLK